MIEGLITGLTRAGLPAGIYSNPAGWAEITGSWQRPDLPFWATVGPRGRATAESRCGTKGLNGGPTHLVQWWDDTTIDWNIACPGFELATPAVTLSWASASPAWSGSGSTNVTVVAGPSRRQTWQLRVGDACTGDTVRTADGVTADRIVQHWDGTTDAGATASPGVYRLALRTGLTTPPTGPTFTALHEIVTAATGSAGRYGTAKVGGCRSTRVWGRDGTATVVSASRLARPTSRIAVLVGDGQRTVAAVAAPYATALGAPLLLTGPDAVPAVVADDLARRGTTSVIAVGSTAALPDALLATLTSRGIRVTRIAGTDPATLAARLGPRVGVARGEVLLAAATDDPRALLAAAPGTGLRVPLLLTGRTALPRATSDTLRRWGASRLSITVVGGTDVVSPAVLDQLRRLGVRSVRRIAGTDPAATSAALAAAYAGRLGGGLTVTTTRFTDLLAAAVLGRPVLLTGATALTAPARSWLDGHPGAAVRVVGTPATVTPQVVVRIR